MTKTLKNEIKYSFSLCEEQKEAKRLIIDNELVIITGSAGTGKTSVVAASVLDLLFKKEIDRIYVVKPTVELGTELGFLKGSLEDKVEPYIEVLIQAMKDYYPHPDKIDSLIAEGKIQASPSQFIRGKNIKEKELLWVDEVQNLTPHETEAIILRLKTGGRIVLSGDTKQCDIKGKNGLDFMLKMSQAIEEIKHMNLVENHRSGLVKKIIDYIYNA